jgi:hypothetical protein
MPMIDDARRRLLLSARQIDVLGALAQAKEVEDDDLRRARSELVECGILDGTYAFHPLAADLARTFMAPTFEFVIEQVGPQGYCTSTVAVRNEGVWSNDPWPETTPDTEVPYVQEELPVLIWTLARLVGARRATPPAGAAAVTVDVGLVDAVTQVFQEAGPEQWATVRTVALAKASEHAAHLDEAARRRWVALVASLVSFWRITSRWADPNADGGQRYKTLAVLDCGSEGYWQRLLDGGETRRLADVTPRTALHLIPRTGGEVWKHLQSLLPTTGELRAAYGRGAA